MPRFHELIRITEHQPTERTCMNENNDPNPDSGVLPSVSVADPGGVDLAGRTVPASNGVQWIGSAWAMFRHRPSPVDRHRPDLRGDRGTDVARHGDQRAVDGADAVADRRPDVRVRAGPHDRRGRSRRPVRGLPGARPAQLALASVGLLTVAIILAGLVVMLVPGVGAIHLLFFHAAPDPGYAPGPAL